MNRKCSFSFSRLFGCSSVFRSRRYSLCVIGVFRDGRIMVGGLGFVRIV